MRIALLSDLHANLPFAEAAVRAARVLSSDRIVHLGDAIDLGPWPSETLDFLQSEDVIMLKGNHEEYSVAGIPQSMQEALDPAVLDHMAWTRARLRVDQIATMATLPLKLVRRIDRFTIRYQHFMIDAGRVSDRRLDTHEAGPVDAFAIGENEIVCFGHTHRREWSYREGRGYLNPGATGFAGADGPMLCQLIVRENAVWTSWHNLECNALAVIREFKARAVPGWQQAAEYMFAVHA